MTLRSMILASKTQWHRTFGALQFFLASEPKKPLWGQSGVLEVKFGVAHDIYTKNDQKRQIKSVLSIFENFQK